MTPYSLYVHIPFCRHRCSYCDFNTYAGLESLIPAYVEALCHEAEFLAANAGERLTLHTIYFGGGTPSLLPQVALERIFYTLQATFNLQPDLEATLEANPGSVSLEFLQSLRSLGINRLSLGMQSAHLEELRMLGRQHDFSDVIQAVEWARAASIDNLSLDLIFGLPGQTLELWAESVARALDLAPQHLSLYALTLEDSTPLQAQVASKQLPEPDPDLAADMYEYASDRLAQAGYLQYEISNWAKTTFRNSEFDIRNPSFVCRHNLQYWRNQPYLGLGAGAHGYALKLRVANVTQPADYIQRLLDPPPTPYDLPPSTCHLPPFPLTPATAESTAVDQHAEIAETMMMGLRLTIEGMSRATFHARFGQNLDEMFAPQISRLIDLGLLEWAGQGGDILRLTPRGHLLGNQVFMEFI